MRPNDYNNARLLASIAALPVEEQTVAIHALISEALKQMSLRSVHAIRAAVADQLSEDIAIVRSTLELIDGQLALREIAGEELWR